MRACEIPKNWGGGSRKPNPIGTAAGLTPEKHATAQLCRRTKFRRSASNSLGVGVRGPNNFWERRGPAPLGRGRGWSHRNMLLPTCVTLPLQIGHPTSNRTSVVTEICPIILTPHAPPFRVTQGHWNRHGSINYL